MEHDTYGLWCWCRPKVENAGFAVVIAHRDVDPPHWMASRWLFGGPEYEDSGEGGRWIHTLP